jgi:hypothetical protein
MIGVGRLAWPEAKLAGIKRRAFNDALKCAPARAFTSSDSPLPAISTAPQRSR